MADTLKEWLKNYDDGMTMESVSMGGMGDGYEIAIQDLAIETMRLLSEEQIPEDDNEFSNIVKKYCDNTAILLDHTHGFSGAQVGAAINMASVFWRQNPERAIEMMKNKDLERIIHIKRSVKNNVLLVK